MSFPNDFTLFDDENSKKGRGFSTPGPLSGESFVSMLGEIIGQQQPEVTQPEPIAMSQNNGTMDARWRQATNPGGFSATRAAMNAGSQPPAPDQQTGVENKYLEPYLKMFSQYLTKPEEDKTRQRKLQNAAVINAIGNALINAVNHMYASNAPIIPISNQGVTAPLAEAERLRQEFLQQQDQYDRLQLGSMWNAVQMAKSDKRYDESIHMSREEAARNERWREEERQFRREERQASQQYGSQQSATEHANRMAAYDTQFQNELTLLNKRQAFERSQLDKELEAKGLGQTANKIGEKPFPVMYNGKSVTLPPEIYWDVMTKELNRMNKPIAEFVTSVDYNSTDNSANAIVTSAWSQYWEPVFDASGNLTGFNQKGGGSGKAGSWTGGASTSGSSVQPFAVPTYFN